MRRRYAHVPAAENPLRPEAPKSPWSRRIGFSAPSGHFRIVLFLIGCFRWVFVPSVYWLGSFFVSSSGFRFPMFSFFDYRGLLRSVRSSLMMAFRSVVFVFCPYWRAYAFRFPGLCVRSFGCLRFSSSVFHWGSYRSFVSRFPLSIRPYPFHGFVFPPPFLLFIRFSFSGFPFVFVFLFSSFPLAWPVCSFPLHGFDRGSSLFRLSVFQFHVRPFSPLHCDAPPGGGGWAYRPRSSASSRRASSRVAWRRWSR